MRVRRAVFLIESAKRGAAKKMGPFFLRGQNFLLVTYTHLLVIYTCLQTMVGDFRAMTRALVTQLTNNDR